MRVLHADALVTGDGEVVRDAAVVVDAGGAIVDLGAAGAVLPRHAGPVSSAFAACSSPAW